MRLTNYTDYSLRVLIYLASMSEDRLVQVKEIAEVYQISKNHLMKVTYDLGKLGYLEATRGRNGGIRLAIDPKRINIGHLVRQTEDDFYLVECFDSGKNGCLISPACRLKGILKEAMQAYLQVLDQYTLADLVDNKEILSTLFRGEDKDSSTR